MGVQVKSGVCCQVNLSTMVGTLEISNCRASNILLQQLGTTTLQKHIDADVEDNTRILMTMYWAIGYILDFRHNIKSINKENSG